MFGPGVGPSQTTFILGITIIPWWRKAVGGCVTFPPGFKSAAVTTMVETVKVRKESQDLLGATPKTLAYRGLLQWNTVLVRTSLSLWWLV